MASRYTDRRVFKNNNNMYYNLLEERGLKHVVQYGSPSMRKLTPAQRAQLVATEHIWTMGDRYYKLAQKHYGDPTLWWAIARYNMKPTESHVKTGDVVYIPFPIHQVLSFYGV